MTTRRCDNCHKEIKGFSHFTIGQFLGKKGVDLCQACAKAVMDDLVDGQSLRSGVIRQLNADIEKWQNLRGI